MGFLQQLTDRMPAAVLPWAARRRSRTGLDFCTYIRTAGAVCDWNAVSGSFASGTLKGAGKEALRVIYIYKRGRMWDLGFVTGTSQPSPLAEC